MSNPIPNPPAGTSEQMGEFVASYIDSNTKASVQDALRAIMAGPCMYGHDRILPEHLSNLAHNAKHFGFTKTYGDFKWPHEWRRIWDDTDLETATRYYPSITTQEELYAVQEAVRNLESRWNKKFREIRATLLEEQRKAVEFYGLLD